jgi:two-component system, cell cycle response regulator
MGSPLQQILQGRGDKKGKSFWISRSIPLFLLASAWIGLFLDFPVTKPGLWFSISVSTLFIIAALHFISKQREFQIAFVFALSLVYSGIISAVHLPWLKVAYFPFVALAASFYSPKSVILLSFLISMLYLKSYFTKETVFAEVAFSFFLILTAAISAFAYEKLRNKEKQAVSNFEKVKSRVREISRESEMESLDNEEAISHYYAEILKTDEEIKELLLTLRHSVLSDSASLFVSNGTDFEVRSSTCEKGEIIISGNGILSGCMQNRNIFFSGDLNEKGADIGYIKNLKISSLIVIPLIDGPVITGLLVVDSSRFQAFSETDNHTVQMFAKQLVRVLERERVYMIIKREVSGLKILKKGSSDLVTSLDINFISQKLSNAANDIANSQNFFFLKRTGKFELKQHTGTFAEKRKRFHLRGTILSLAVENPLKMHHYVSDTTGHPLQVMPFETKHVRSVLAVPMRFKNVLLGVFVMLSDKRDFLDSVQINLLEVLCNQASAAIANANLHAEIEKLATTDGLTGLFNHRWFQEKLSEEFKRMDRYTSPVSLILTDIDHFKKVNDTYGHPAGDSVLKEVSKIIRKEIRDVDIPARYGGEEFAVILPGTDSEGCKKIAERLRTAVMGKTFSADGKELKVTISIGIATAPVDSKTKEELIEKTDQALYNAKNNGRNRSVTWSEI